MIADIVSTFGLSLAEVDKFDWTDMVRWHGQHLRIQEERTHLAQITSQLSALSMLGGVPEENREDVPQWEED